MWLWKPTLEIQITIDNMKCSIFGAMQPILTEKTKDSSRKKKNYDGEIALGEILKGHGEQQGGVAENHPDKWRWLVNRVERLVCRGRRKKILLTERQTDKRMSSQYMDTITTAASPSGAILVDFVALFYMQWQLPTIVNSH